MAKSIHNSLVMFVVVLVNLHSLFHYDSRVHAVEVTADSPCSNFCINSPGLNISDIASSQTFSGDLSCLDSDYNGDNSTAIGRKFRSCVSCEQTSKAVDTIYEENDVYWFLFNLKSTVVWCVQGFFESEQNPNTTLANTQCNSACDTIGNALEDRLKQTNESLQYNYCTSNNGAFMSGVDKCTNCLVAIDNLKILGNFLSALKSACQQKPALSSTISLSTNVFSITGATSSPSISTPTSSSTNSASSIPTAISSSSISGGAIAGIAVGTVAGLAILATVVYLLLRRRKKSGQGQGKMGELDGTQSQVPGYRQGKEYKQHAPGHGSGNGYGVLQQHSAYGYNQPSEMGAERPLAELPVEPRV
ncbi:uncharacterized protein BDR25DRAFT_340660 [Lindgomyces ingoldianus]|uniref:Uncharacterized protein n=1 Tax=Lindgomyces ingoldianus TaxID=673940 RepID=A0ACB6R4C3_9PLEO|nr:uncharacterized protein BDR25DRAFT_340660 [Lindgomyces ingoldianus]KAF2474031.1 hypothetical protein BDR25DRAFT_340660 [Lindgomyces ingoldianus]